MLPPEAANRPRAVVRALSAVTFLEWFGASVGLPLLPVYLEDRGASSVTVGLVVAAYFVAGVLLQYVFGRLVDKVTPTPVLRAGLVIFAIGGLSLALPLTPGLVRVSRLLQGAGAGRRRGGRAGHGRRGRAGRAARPRIRVDLRQPARRAWPSVRWSAASSARFR